MLTSYCPEMNEVRPADTQIDSRYAGPGHYTLKTFLDLSGRGITFCGFEKGSETAIGRNQYRVTTAAFERICRKYRVGSEALLD